MTHPLNYGEEPSQAVLNRPMRSSESPGTYDALFNAVCPQRPDMPRPEGPPRVPLATAGQKAASIRPVYNDFATAHSSITSRSAQSQYPHLPRRNFKKQRDLLNPSLVSPQRTQAFGSQIGYSQLDWNSTQPPKARLSLRRELSDIDLDISDVNFSSTRPPEPNLTTNRSSKQTPKLSSPSRFFGSIRKALGSRSSPKVESSKRHSHLSTKYSLKVSNGSPQIYSQSQEKVRDTFGSNQHVLKAGYRQELKPKSPTSSNEMLLCSRSQDVDVSLGPSVSDWSTDGLNHAYHYEKGTKSTTSQSTGGFSDNLDIASCSHSKIGKDLGSQATSSARRESTVNNIVKNYVRDDRLWPIRLNTDNEKSEEKAEFSQQNVSRHCVRPKLSNSNAPGMENNTMRTIKDNSRLKHSDKIVQELACTFRLKEFQGRAPNATLPQPPPLAGQQVVRSLPDDIGQPFSYGNTQKLLETVQPQQLFATSDGSIVESSHAAIDSNLCPGCDCLDCGLAPNPSSLPLLNTSTPPLLVLDRQTFPLKQKISRTTRNSLIASQIAHEREVSAALHRMSAFSNPSQETPVSLQGNGGFQSSTDSADLHSFIYKQLPCAPDHQIVANEGFYDESAIHQTWLDSHQFERIRIPVNRSASVCSALHGSNSRSIIIEQANISAFGAADEDARDWETVFESGDPSQPATYPHRPLNRLKRVGSSLANNSDDGINAPVLYQHDDFSSTDRIIQHPAQLELSHDYRYRETKEGSFPILLPSYKPSTINGFPMDSCRSISTSQNNSYGVEFQAPTPLSNNHTNPFTSSPPELLKVTSSCNSSDDLSDWVNELGGHKSPTEPSRLFSNLSAAAASGRSHLEAHSRTMTIGSSIADASTVSSDILDEQPPRNTQDRDATFIFMNLGTHANQSQYIPRELPAFAEGTRRSFYETVGSNHVARQEKQSIAGRTGVRCSKRVTSQPYPTNQMRPLSLVEAQRAQRRAATSESPRGNTGYGGFLYRSPLAPIKSRSWRHLYTRDQLSNIGNAAKADGVYDLESLSQQSSRLACSDAMTTNAAWKHLSWRPQMFAWPQEDSSIQSDLASQKKRLSNIAFGFCCLFPPLLILYGSGYMDGIMLWITNGDITSFGKNQKRTALQLVCFLVIVLVISVAVIAATKSTAS